MTGPTWAKYNFMGKRITKGEVFHRLTVESFSHVHIQPSGQRKSYYLCKCACGKRTTVSGSNLRGQHPVKSCGCANREHLDLVKREGSVHGMSKTRTWDIWVNVVARGTGKEQAEKYYDRGIRVCERWLQFVNFFEDMGECPEGMSIDRIDNDGNYQPLNCRWATPKQQGRNTRKSLTIEFRGRSGNVCDFAEELGICPRKVRQRLRLGWTVERSLTS